jgi:hypothetical protein
MEEVQARANLVEPTAGGDLDGFTITMPRGEVEDALAAEDTEAELLLDVVRGENGDAERRRVAVALTREDLERMIREARDDRVAFVIPPDSLEQAFETDVEAHGLREAVAALTVAIVVSGGGVAQAGIDPGGGGATGSGDSYAAIESARVDTAAPDRFAAIEQVRAERTAPGAADTMAGVEQIRAERTAPGSGPDTMAGVEQIRAERTAPGSGPDTMAGVEQIRAERTAPGTGPDTLAAVEQIRAERTAPGSPTDALAGVEQIRAERTAPGSPTDALAGVEQIRAERTAPQPASSGITISAPDAAQTAGIAGAAALMIVGAAFAARRRRAPGLA